MEAKTHIARSGDGWENNDNFLEFPAGEETREIPAGRSIEETLTHFEELRLQWMERHYDAEARRAGMNAERFRL